MYDVMKLNIWFECGLRQNIVQIYYFIRAALVRVRRGKPAQYATLNFEEQKKRRDLHVFLIHKTYRIVHNYFVKSAMYRYTKKIKDRAYFCHSICLLPMSQILRIL